MKKSLLLISALVFFGNLCTAQIDSIKKTSDSSAVKAKAESTNSVSSKVPSDTSQYALLYVYRHKNFTGSAVSYDLKITNSVLKEFLIGRVKNNSKFVVAIYQEGKTEISATTESKRFVTVNVKFGQKYYLKCGVSMGWVVGKPELNLVYPDQGELEYENVKIKKE